MVANGVGRLKSLDALLVLAINQANIAPLTRDSAARIRYGQLDAPAPDEERRPISVSSIADSLGIPFETARRRVRRLEADGACATWPDGVVVPATFLASPAYVQSVVVGHERLRAFYVEIGAAGLIEPLPPPTTFSPAEDVPIRAAARLLADYVLRASDGLMRQAGDVISALVLLALLGAVVGAERRVEAVAPVRVIAERLQLPLETVRRHADRLVGQGLCQRVAGGLAMTEDNLSCEGLRLWFAENAANVQRLMAGLAERGVVLGWEEAQVAEGRRCV
ncbi:hypothetical protein DJ021_14760 [Phenylobacterium hankyongense]|uniref:Uncharacterized protein n=1 Tax=Phenylobacterium hankyongense TaxID=1813876 RepID=A0A328B7N4_9CAUL|nr:hypothetical protein DJ021_14760 [Phenylobacterium hankyongense]